MLDQKTGEVLSGDVIHQLKDRFTGEQIGLSYLSTFLAQREEDLRKRVKQQDIDNQQNQS